MEDDKPAIIKIEKKEDLTETCYDYEIPNIQSDLNKIYIKVEPKKLTQFYENETLEIVSVKLEREKDYSNAHSNGQYKENIKIGTTDVKQEDCLNDHIYWQHSGNINIGATNITQELPQFYTSMVPHDISDTSQYMNYATEQHLVASGEHTRFPNPYSEPGNICIDIIKSDGKGQCLSDDGQRDSLNITNLKEGGKMRVNYLFTMFCFLSVKRRNL